MRKLINIFLVFSLLVTVFTVNTFAEGESDGQDTSEPQAEVLDDQSTTGSQDDLESIPQDENSGTQVVQDSENEILSSESETESQVLSDSESNDDLASYTVEQIDNGDVVITFDSAEHAKLVGWVTFEEVMKTRGVSSGASAENLIYEGNQVIIKYDIITNFLQLKKESTYKVILSGSIFNIIDRTPKELTLSKGVDSWSITATVDENSNLILLSDNAYVNTHIDYIYISTEEYYEGYDCSAIFQGGELIREESRVYVLGDYIKTYNFKKDADYSVKISYSTELNGKPVENSVFANAISFDYEQLIGPKLNVYVDDGILFIESQDEIGADYLNTLYNNRDSHYSDEIDFMLSINGSNAGYNLNINSGFIKTQEGLRFPLYSLLEDSQSIDIRDDYQIKLRVPGKGLSEITFAINEDSMKLDSATISQDESGNITISAGPDLKLESVDRVGFVSIELDESNSPKYRDWFSGFYDKTTGNIVIPYFSIEGSELKGESDYKVYFDFNDGERKLIFDSYKLIKGSIRQYLSSRQDADGNIVIEISDNEICESFEGLSLESVFLSGFDENKRYYSQIFNNISNLISDNTITIPYNQIEYSNLKQGIEYSISLNNGNTSFWLPVRLTLNKGSVKKDAPDYSVSQNDNGDIVFSFGNADSPSIIDLIRFKGYGEGKDAYFSSEKFNCEGNIVTIPYNIIEKSRLVEGEYQIDIYHDSKLYFNNIPSKRIIITSGTKLPSLPDFSIFQEDDGDIVIESENSNFIKAIDRLDYIIGGYTYYFYSSNFIFEDNRAIIPYKYVVISNLTSGNTFTFIIQLKSDDTFLYEDNDLKKDVLISKGSIAQYLSSRQDADGNIIIEMSDNEICESFEDLSLESAFLSSSDENNGRNYNQVFYNIGNLISGNTITIPYSQIEYSNLKQGLEYSIELNNADNYCYLPARLLLNKGSKRKDAPDYSVSQNDNGDIVLSFGNADFPSNINQVGFYGYKSGQNEYFSSDKLVRENKTITIPYSIIEKSQLVEGEYGVDIYHDSKLYFDDIPRKRITITSGTKLPSLPDFSIFQEDDGDIVIESENSDLIKSINYLNYDVGSYEYGFYSSNFILEDNRAIIPYKYVAMSNLTSGNTFTFRIQLKSDDIFLYENNNLKKDVLINKGSIRQYLSSRQDADGNIIIEMSDNEICESFENLSLESVSLSASDENNGRYYSQRFYDISNLTYGNTIAIPYSQIEYSNLKQGLEYSIELHNGDNYCNLPARLLLNKGSVKKDVPDYSVSQKDNGDIVLSFDNVDFPSKINHIWFDGYKSDKSEYFNSEKIIREGNVVTIPYSIIEKSQLVEGEYWVDIYYDSKLYFDNIPRKRIIITSGTKLPPLPDFSIFQEDDGDIVISSENSQFIKAIGYVHYSVEGHGYTFINEALEREENRITVPYDCVLMSNLKTGIISEISIGLKSVDIFLGDNNPISKEIEIKKGSATEYFSAKQDEDGNIIIEMSDNEICESFEDLSLESVSLSGSDENNGRYYSQIFNNISNLISDNTITIPYNQIEYSNLKQGIEYSISLNNGNTSFWLPVRLTLNKGSVKKDAPDYSVSQNDNGDIVLSFDNADFPSNVNRIDFSELSTNSYASFYDDRTICEGKIITIPYSIIEKSQLVEGEYWVDIYYDSKLYFDNIPRKRIIITSGTKLPPLPDFSIFQEDDGDIVIESENSDLIKSINYLNYDVGSYEYGFYSSNFILEDNRAIIPYKYVAMSNLTSGNTFTFRIQLKSDDIFLYENNNLKKDVLINKGSIRQYLSSRQDADGNIIIEMSDNEICESFEDLSLESAFLSSSDENNGRNYNQVFYNIGNLISGNTITIPYSQIEYSNLKQGLEYSIELNNADNYCYLPARLLLNKGSKRKDAPDYSVSQNDNGDIVFSFGNTDFPSDVNQIDFSGLSTNSYASFSSNRIVSEGKIITIPYSIIEKSQLVEGEYWVDIYHDSKLYFDNIPSKRITITSGTKLPSIPDFNIYQEDDGDIVIESESEELIANIGEVSYYSLSNHRAGGYYYFYDKDIIKESKKVVIPYTSVMFSKLESNGNYSFTIELESDDVFLYNYESRTKEILIKKGSLLDEIEIVQQENGNIEFTLNNILEAANVFGLINTIEFENNSKRVYRGLYLNKEDLIIAANKITVPYSEIEYSNLEGSLEYTVYINSCQLSDEILIIKGSKKKEAVIESVVQKDNGDIVITSPDADIIRKTSRVSFRNSQIHKNVTFYSDTFSRNLENNTIFISYETVKKSQLIEGEYEFDLWFDDLYKDYYYDYNSCSVSIKKGTTLPNLPDFEIYQKENGDIVLYSDSKELIKEIEYIAYSPISNQRAGGGPALFMESFIVEDNTITIPYSAVILSYFESDKMHSFNIVLKSDDKFLYDYEDATREVFISKGSIRQNLSSKQDENGNIIIEISDNEICESFENLSLESIYLGGYDEVNDRNYQQNFYNISNLISGNTIIIPYNQIEYSNLKQGIEYLIEISNDNASFSLPARIILNKGSVKKDVPDYSVSQKDNGDIVFSFGNADFPSNITQIYFYGYRHDWHDYFSSDRLTYEGSTITIPYSVVQNSRLVEGDYYVRIYYDTDQYFDTIPEKIISIISGSTLPTLPDFSIFQEDDGDIVIESENSDLIKSINYLNYDVGSYEYGFYSSNFILEDNRAIIPYKYVAMSNLTSGNTFTFRIQLKSDDIFLYENNDLKKDVLINKGSIEEYLSSRQDADGNIIIEINDNETCESFGNLSLESVSLSSSDENNGRYYNESFYNISNLISGNTITIPYNRIEYSNLKQGLEYSIELHNGDNYCNLPARLLLNKGSVKKDAPDYSVSQNDNGDIVFDFHNLDFSSLITVINFSGENLISFDSGKISPSENGNIVTIPYSIIEKSQLVEGEYWVDIYYDSKLYFDSIPRKRIIITSGTKLPSLPDFNIYQEDDGDIVLYSDSCELIKLINYIGYYSLNSQRAGAPAFFEESFVVDENTITIPYQVVKYSYIEDNALHEFNIALKNNDVFLNNGNDTREAFIKYGSLIKDALYLDVNSDISGVLSIQFDNNDTLIKLSEGEYELNYLPLNSCEKEIRVNEESLIFDYSNHRVYIVSGIEHESLIHLNIMYGDEIIATTVTQINSEPVMNYEKAMENVDTEKVLSFAYSYYESLYPNINILIGGIGIYADVVHENDADDFFKLYGLSKNNSLVIDISLLPNYIGCNTSSNVEIVKIPYDYPREYIEVEFSVSSEQMSKLGINKDNYSQNTISVLREHNGKVDVLDATFEPVKAGDVIISYKVKFKTDKMSLFAVANKNSIFKPSSGGSGNGGSSATVPVKKPVVNTVAK